MPAPPPRIPRLVVLASGRGSNLQALLDATATGELAAEVVGVVSDRRRAAALQRAREAGIPAVAVAPAAFGARRDFDRALAAEAAALDPDYIVCAGFMRLLGGDMVEPWHGRMLNIHPSLLPAFKGLDTHARALQAGIGEHGASVHFVTADLDGGPVIAQARVPVLPGDDADRLAARVLEQEHPLLVATLGLLCDGRVRLHEHRVHLDGQALDTPLQLASKRGFA